MHTLVCVKPGQFQYHESDMPEPKKGFVIVKIKRVGICGTDIHAFEGTQPYFDYPRILGHELSGELVQFFEEDLPGFEMMDAVTIIPYFYCGHCIACRNGKTNCCTSIQVSGVHTDGGFQEYISVPAYSLVKGNELSYDELALVEPLAIGAHGIRRAAIKTGEFVLVSGAGPIGLGLMEFARINGGNVIALDVNEKRLAFCKERLHIEHTINAGSVNVETELLKITNGDMPTVVIDATGNLKAINKAFSYMAAGGRYVMVGLQKQDVTVNHPEFHKREGSLMSSRNATREDFEFVIACLKTKKINPMTYITHRMPFEQLKSNFENLLMPDTGLVKAMISLS